MKGIINYPFVNVREKPNGNITQIVTGGTELTVSAVKDGWAKTSIGYVREDLIDITEEKKKKNGKL